MNRLFVFFYDTAQHLRCIERLYGDNGLEIVDLLHANPRAALPVILNRLKQKQKEISRRQVNLENDWTEASTKYYSRSLDHRSFYFKQQDKKTLSSEGSSSVKDFMNLISLLPLFIFIYVVF